MSGFDFNSNSLNSTNDSDATPGISTAILLMLLSSVVVMTYQLARLAKANNRFNYDNDFAKIIAGLLLFVLDKMHVQSNNVKIDNSGKTLITGGPHRTGWEAAVIGSALTGPNPPSFLATDGFNIIPGVGSFLKMFKTIPVEAKPQKAESGRSANAGALENANRVLEEDGCVALFPQGNFSKLNQEPPTIYRGAAILAVRNQIPIHVIRMDGFNCLSNTLIPEMIRNNLIYRAFLSFFHRNNISITLSVIDFHLQEENTHLSEEEKITEICAQLYAKYRHTADLNPAQNKAIEQEISDKKHLLIWENRAKRDALNKQLLELQKERIRLEEPTSTAMQEAAATLSPP